MMIIDSEGSAGSDADDSEAATSIIVMVVVAILLCLLLAGLATLHRRKTLSKESAEAARYARGTDRALENHMYGCNADAAIAPGIGSGGNAALYATAGNTAGVGGGSGAEDGQGKERAGAVPNPTYGGAAALYLDTDIEQQPIYSEALTPDDSARYDTVYVESVATAGPDEQPLYSEPAVNAETDGCYSGANTAV